MDKMEEVHQLVERAEQRQKDFASQKAAEAAHTEEIQKTKCGRQRKVCQKNNSHKK